MRNNLYIILILVGMVIALSALPGQFLFDIFPLNFSRNRLIVGIVLILVGILLIFLTK